jgi:CMP-N-acetylneuraminic acid synthetase
MRQDRAGRWVENGAIYIVKRDLLIANRIRYGGQIGIVEMPMHRSFQVDTMDDLELIKKCLT